MKHPAKCRFEKKWRLVEGLSQTGHSSKMIDVYTSEYCEWQAFDENDQPIMLYGMRKKDTLEPNGFVRIVTARGDVIQGTFKDGKTHGLTYLVSKDYVKVQISILGEQVATLEFDAEFEPDGAQENKWDREGYLEDTSVTNFKRI